MGIPQIRIDGERLYIRTVQPEDKDIVWNYRQEFFDYDSYFAGDSGLKLFDNFEDWYKKIEISSNQDTLPADRVLGTQFLTFRKEDNKLVGMINLRHSLNDYLLKFGGHIGDSIRPTERSKGYATEQKKICLEFCKSIGLDKVLITAKSNNEHSIKSIIKSGGVLENTIEDKENSVVYHRFWVTLS